MPALTNQKHEIFAQGIAKGLSNSDAYKEAGYEVKSDGVASAAATRLLKDVKISERVQELQERSASGVMITRQLVLEELASIGLAPLGDEFVKANDKRAALMDIAKIEGWVIDRQEKGAPGEFSGLTADERRAVAESVKRELASRISGDRSGEQAKPH